MSQSKILNTCECLCHNNWTLEVLQKPSTYINFMRFWNSIYKLHFKYEHVEKLVSKEIVLEFLSNCVDLLYFFRRQINKVNRIVCTPIEKPELLNVPIFECSKTMESIRKENRPIDITVLYDTFDIIEQTLTLWETYTINNKINVFY